MSADNDARPTPAATAIEGLPMLLMMDLPSPWNVSHFVGALGATEGAITPAEPLDAAPLEQLFEGREDVFFGYEFAIQGGNPPTTRSTTTSVSSPTPTPCAGAFLIVIVFAGFAAGEVLAIKELGVGLAIAVLVDATLIRTVLVPTTMKMLGERNW
jgi:hypothetical protein